MFGRRSRLLKKADIVLILSVVATAVIGFAALSLFSKNGNTVKITQDSKTVYEGLLKENTEIELSGNTVVIKDGCAYMKNATCKNQICIHSGSISKKGESIICLPNRVTVEISE